MNDTPEQHIVHDIIKPQGHGFLSHSRDRGSRNPIVLGPASAGNNAPDIVLNGRPAPQMQPPVQSAMPQGPAPLGMQVK